MRSRKNRVHALTKNPRTSWVGEHPKAAALALSVAALSAIFLTLILVT